MHLQGPAGHCERPRDDGDGDDGDGDDGECAVSARDYLTALTEGTGGKHARLQGARRRAPRVARADARPARSARLTVGRSRWASAVRLRRRAAERAGGVLAKTFGAMAEASFDQETVVEEARVN